METETSLHLFCLSALVGEYCAFKIKAGVYMVGGRPRFFHDIGVLKCM